MIHIYYFKTTWYDWDEQKEKYETGFVPAESAGETYATFAETYCSDFVGAYLEEIGDNYLICDENVAHDIMEQQW